MGKITLAGKKEGTGNKQQSIVLVELLNLSTRNAYLQPDLESFRQRATMRTWRLRRTVSH